MTEINTTATAPAAGGETSAATAAEAESNVAQAAEGFDGSGAAEASPEKTLEGLSLDAEAGERESAETQGEQISNAEQSETEKTPTPDSLRELADKLMEDRVRIAIDSELGRVRGCFPEIKELGDIIRLKRYPEIKERVERGYSLSDAVKLCYEDVYLARRQRAAAAEARSASYSTSHLKATHPKGSDPNEVSESAIRDYLAAIPGATREQAIAAHRKYKVMGVGTEGGAKGK